MAEKIKFTKYETARVIGARALQIGMGAPFLLKLDKEKLEEINYNPVEIAKMEFEKNILPINVKRPMPVKN
ncbi:MAG: DNA-directed RNA polymerase subunit K [Nanoarchaeota archaeon]